MKAEPFDCAVCGRRIGARRGHLITEDHHMVVCVRCLDQKAHAAIYPDCPIARHDVYDHGTVHGTRAGTRWWLAQHASKPTPCSTSPTPPPGEDDDMTAPHASAMSADHVDKTIGTGFGPCFGPCFGGCCDDCCFHPACCHEGETA